MIMLTALRGPPWSLEHVVELLSDSDESGSSTQFLQFLGPDVGTG